MNNRRIRPALLLAVIGSASAEVIAQTPVVSPSHFVNAAGSSTALPLAFGSPAASRFMQIHEDLPTLFIQSIAFRRANTIRAESLPARTIDVTIRMSHAATTASNPDPLFLANHGSDITAVVLSETVNFPAVPNGAANPQSFTDVITLTTPFLYDGVRPLCWEIEAVDPPGAPRTPYDAFASPNPNPSPRFAQIQNGCISTTTSLGSPFELFMTPMLDWTGSASSSISQRIVGAPTDRIGTLFIGVGAPAGIPLPGTNAGSSGLCTLELSPFATLPIAIDATGTGTIGIPVAPSPTLHGATLITQAAAIDPPASSLGVVTSHANTLHLIAPYGQIPISQLTGHPGIGRGLVAVGAGVVIEFQ